MSEVQLHYTSHVDATLDKCKYTDEEGNKGNIEREESFSYHLNLHDVCMKLEGCKFIYTITQS